MLSSSAQAQKMSSPNNNNNLSSAAEERRQRRRAKQQQQPQISSLSSTHRKVRRNNPAFAKDDDNRFTALMARKEDEVLNFVAQVNKVYQDLLRKPAPFMTFILCGMQSAGKSTIMERFLNDVLNIVQEGTGTRCPLNTTCIHDKNCTMPVCELYGRCDKTQEELPLCGKDLSVEDVFTCIMSHNSKLAGEDRFSTEPLYLNFRSCNVQNMRFVDTPGIIATQGTGKDNREEIKTILRNEMEKPNTKLCVLLQPDELQNNLVIDFCDETFGKPRENWICNATFVMNKFDKKIGDAKSATKANDFFKTFYEIGCYPHLVITPTVPNDKIETAYLFKARKDMLNSADRYESEKFKEWRNSLRSYQTQHEDEDLDAEIVNRIGFQSARDIMRKIMLKDIVERLPEVLVALRKDLQAFEEEYQFLEEKKRLSSASDIKYVATQMLFEVQNKLKSYLDGNISVAKKFPKTTQTLEDEINDEEDSDWKNRKLNCHAEKEEEWRTRVEDLLCCDEEGDEQAINAVRVDERFLGGKQYQRAIEFFEVVMTNALPDPSELKELIPQATGYAQDGLQQENWERAMVETVRTCLQDVSQPGVNYLIKHTGTIFRHLFFVALEDVKTGHQLSNMFNNLPPGVEQQMVDQYENLLWELMSNAADATHLCLEPFFSMIDPNLPTFVSPSELPETPYSAETSLSTGDEMDGGFTFEKSLRNAKSWISGKEAKKEMRNESIRRITARKVLLPERRSSMITDEECDIIVKTASDYIFALFKFILFSLKCQMNHYLYQGYKEAIQGKLITQMDNIDWDELVNPDPEVEERMKTLEKQIEGLRTSLSQVKRMGNSF